MTKSASRLWAILLVVLLTLAAALPLAAAPGNATDRRDARPAIDTASAFVQLRGEPLATAPTTKPARGKKIDFNSAAVKNYRAQLAAQRNDFASWLRANAPKARVTSAYDISLNAVSVQLNGTSLATLRSAPQVLSAEYQGLYYPTADPATDPDLALISAIEAWGAGGSADAGAGIKVAIIDTGIDISHPCFSDAGYQAQAQLGDRRFTNNKVIAARVFSNLAGVAHFTPAAIQSHGSHVAGTVACNFETPASVDGVSIPYKVSGVAPRALLGNYNVFPGSVSNARSEDIANALEAAYADGFDVANMSLGGGASGKLDLLTLAVDNLDRANMVVAVAAGNEGPGHYTVSSPGSAARALTAGASTVPHFVGAPVTVSGQLYGAATGEFATVSSDLTAPLGIVAGTTNGLDTACTALSPGSLTSKIALISRGGCTFSTKIRNAQNAGAVAVLVANQFAGDPVAMAADGTANQPTVPAYMVGRSSVAGLLAAGNGASATIGSALSYISSPNKDIMAGFSSQGPTDVDFRVKPDVVAPGVNVLSAVPASACLAPPCWAFFQGTSMATPHLAGSAAVVLSQHPGWSAAQVRSAIVNTADRGVLRDYRTGTQVVADVNTIGAGRENLARAVQATVAIEPVSVSFGAVPAGSGQTRSQDVSIANLTSSDQQIAVNVAGGGSGATFRANVPSVTIPAGGTTVVTITVTVERGSGAGDKQALLILGGPDSPIAHAALYVLVR